MSKMCVWIPSVKSLQLKFYFKIYSVNLYLLPTREFDVCSEDQCVQLQVERYFLFQLDRMKKCPLWLVCWLQWRCFSPIKMPVPRRVMIPVSQQYVPVSTSFTTLGFLMPSEWLNRNELNACPTFLLPLVIFLFLFSL